MSKKTVLMILMLMIGGAQAWGETETKTEGFETASTGSYGSTNTISSDKSDCGIEWTIFYGAATTNSPITGSKSCLLRWFKNESNTFGYARTTTPIKGLTNVTFKAKVTSTIIRMVVSYSTNGSNWKILTDGAISLNGTSWTPFTDEGSKAVSTSPYYFSYDIPSSSPTTNYYLRIQITCGSTTSQDQDLIIDDVVFTYTKSDEVTVADGQTLAINTPTEMEKLTVEAGGTVSGEAALTVKDLIIKSSLGAVSGSGDTNGKCGEITHTNIVPTGDVFFELDMTPAAEASYGWYAFSVPFAVSATEGIYFGETKLTNGTDYAIMAYRGDIRAQGQYAWVKHSGELEPGVLYIISVGDTDYKTLRFKKKASASLYNDVVDGMSHQMATQEFASNDPDNAGWNGLGNPYLQTAHIGSADLQFLDHEANAFKVRSGDEVKLMVGSAFFYQSDGSAITVTKEQTGSIALAPARTPSTMEQTTYEVRLLNAAGEEEDRLFLRASEEATETYEIGRDVAKLSMGDARCAQIWIPAYGTQLCAAYFPIENGQATYPLTLCAPAAGTYTIATKAANEAEVYLTKEGIVLRDLTASDCEVELAQGTNEGYGLLLKEKKMPTGVEQSVFSNQSSDIRKVVLNEKVFILREGKMYDTLGRMME
jgi:hypothetical protein